MADGGWKELVRGWPWFRGEGRFPIAAYSEYMPPPYLGLTPCGRSGEPPFAEDDPWGWPVTEYEETLELRPGLEQLAGPVVRAVVRLGRGRPGHGLPDDLLTDNPYWPPELAEKAGELPHEHHVVLLPLALSRTKDDKGRLPWTLFGGSEQGPGQAFWKSFWTAPGEEVPAVQALAFVRRLLASVFGEPDEHLGDLRRAGFRVLPLGGAGVVWREDALPRWTEPFLLGEVGSVRGVRYVLTFRPFLDLPARVRRAYLAGDLHLIPCPGSLVFWGAAPYLRLSCSLPFAIQVPLLHLAERHDGPGNLRVPQSGWFVDPPPARDGPGRHHYRRRHRSGHGPEREDPIARTLFDTDPDVIGLYHKPMARNAQLWTEDYRLLLDGPHASREEIHAAAEVVREGGRFGYRFLFPAMRVGTHEVYWHRSLVAHVPPGSEKPVLLPDAPLGYLTAYDTDGPNFVKPVELWPRLLRRELPVANVELFGASKSEKTKDTLLNVRKLDDARRLLGGNALPASFARQLLTLPKDHTLEGWLRSLPSSTRKHDRAHELVTGLRGLIADGPTRAAELPPSLTFGHTARRSFEVAYWKTIALLSGRRYLTKNNADPILDTATQAAGRNQVRELDYLATDLLLHHWQAIAQAGMADRALGGVTYFGWPTDFVFPWMGGWLSSQENRCNKDVIVVIPGSDRRRAVLMADHYDTAYMSDHYEKSEGGDGARLAAPGADDNGSATAALMLAAPIFLELSRTGQLGCDIWLIHLTGEEFPAESLGARHLCQRLIEGALRPSWGAKHKHDLRGVRVQGIFVLDMIAHNSRQGRDIFQVSPGAGAEAMWLALQAHLAAEAWNSSTEVWNRSGARRGKGRGRRSRDGSIPPLARFPRLHGEIRPQVDPNSTLYNSDGVIFSDAGFPAVLLMENYDVNRRGYHDSHDTMGNINLDYGAALAAIAIEAVARAATTPPPA